MGCADNNGFQPDFFNNIAAIAVVLMLTKSSCTDRETASGAADRISLSPSFMRSRLGEEAFGR